MIDDYYNEKEYNEIEDGFYETMERIKKTNRYYDYFLDYLNLSEEDKEKLPRRYEINEDAYLFRLIRTYALLNKKMRKAYVDHPFIEKINLDKGKVQFKTIYGDANFEFWIKSFEDVLKRSIKTSNPIQTYRLYSDEYFGKYNGRCHEGAITFGCEKKVVTALIDHPIKGLRILHSFTEGEKILEPTVNLLFSKEDYFRMLKPEIITEIKGNDLYEYYLEYLTKYPRLKKMSTKQMLTEFDEIKKNPKTIKIKPYNLPK